ncbi:MAG TPA: hypothetical protein PLD25_30225 [Chloroflexota bacterium]|nr:hypothetical protein [Chloroflexota bacterium]HUM68106.1 hypothetical protein [Chloroflexota bacterium]
MAPVLLSPQGRPITRKDPIPKANGAATKQPNGQAMKPAPPTSDQPAKASPTVNGQPAKPDTTVATEQPLKYGDGHMVDGQNLTEVQTFQRYKAEKKTTPESKAVLLDYYRHRTQVPVNSNVTI